MVRPALKRFWRRLVGKTPRNAFRGRGSEQVQLPVIKTSATLPDAASGVSSSKRDVTFRPAGTQHPVHLRTRSGGTARWPQRHIVARSNAGSQPVAHGQRRVVADKQGKPMALARHGWKIHLCPTTRGGNGQRGILARHIGDLGKDGGQLHQPRGASALNRADALSGGSTVAIRPARTMNS